jgi:hypothetical protein
MLTAEAYADRKWGRYAALRRLLETRRLPDSFFGPTSVSDNLFDWFHRTLEVSLLACECESEIQNAAETLGPTEIIEDLRRVRDDLHAMRSRIDETSGRLERLQAALWRDQALKRTGQGNP